MGKEQMYLRENEETVTITHTYKRHSITHFVQHQLKHRTMEISGVHNTMTSQTKDGLFCFVSINNEDNGVTFPNLRCDLLVANGWLELSH